MPKCEILGDKTTLIAEVVFKTLTGKSIRFNLCLPCTLRLQYKCAPRSQLVGEHYGWETPEKIIFILLIIRISRIFNNETFSTYYMVKITF